MAKELTYYSAVIQAIEYWIWSFASELYNDLSKVQVSSGQNKISVFDAIMRSRLPEAFNIINQPEQVQHIKERLAIECKTFCESKSKEDTVNAICSAFNVTQSIIMKSKHREGVISTFIDILKNYLVSYIKNSDELNDKELMEAYASLMAAQDTEEVEQEFNNFKEGIAHLLHGLKDSSTKEEILKYCCAIFSNASLSIALSSCPDLLAALVVSMKFYLLRGGETNISIHLPDRDNPIVITSMSIFAWILDFNHEGILNVLRNTANIRLPSDIWVNRNAESEDIFGILINKLDKLTDGKFQENNCYLYIIRLLEDLRGALSKIFVSSQCNQSVLDKNLYAAIKHEIFPILKSFEPLIMKNLLIIKKVKELVQKNQREETGVGELNAAVMEALSILEIAYYKLGAILFYYSELLKKLQYKNQETLSSNASGKEVEELYKLLANQKLNKELMHFFAEIQEGLNPEVSVALKDVKKIKILISQKIRQYFAKKEQAEKTMLKTCEKYLEKHVKLLDPGSIDEVYQNIACSLSPIDEMQRELLHLVNDEPEGFITLIREEKDVEEAFVDIFKNRDYFYQSILSFENSLTIIKGYSPDIYTWLLKAPEMINRAQYEQLAVKEIGYQTLVEQDAARLGMKDVLATTLRRNVSYEWSPEKTAGFPSLIEGGRNRSMSQGSVRASATMFPTPNKKNDINDQESEKEKTPRQRTKSFA